MSDQSRSLSVWGLTDHHKHPHRDISRKSRAIFAEFYCQDDSNNDLQVKSSSIMVKILAASVRHEAPACCDILKEWVCFKIVVIASGINGMNELDAFRV